MFHGRSLQCYERIELLNWIAFKYAKCSHWRSEPDYTQWIRGASHCPWWWYPYPIMKFFGENLKSVKKCVRVPLSPSPLPTPAERLFQMRAGSGSAFQWLAQQHIGVDLFSRLGGGCGRGDTLPPTVGTFPKIRLSKSHFRALQKTIF